VAPTSSTITSTYGPRWGNIHYGLDIANEIGTRPSRPNAAPAFATIYVRI
jgi:murein DD-endopeptidase MepM/ murein hydrolase activator NlpD